MQHTVYLAGPITGLTYNQATAWRDRVTSDLAPGILTISPLRGKELLVGHKQIEAYDNDILACQMPGVVRRDFYDIERCSLMLVNLLAATEISRGTLVEIGYTAALHKPVIVAMESGSVHDHPFVTEPALYVVDELEKAIVLCKVVLMP